MTTTQTAEIVPRALQNIHSAFDDLKHAIADSSDVRGAYLLWQDCKGLATTALALVDEASKKADALMEET